MTISSLSFFFIYQLVCLIDYLYFTEFSCLLIGCSDNLLYTTASVPVKPVANTITYLQRDRRVKDGRLDKVNFNLLSPYTIDKMVRGIKVLEQLKSLSGATSDTYAYQSAPFSSGGV